MVIVPPTLVKAATAIEPPVSVAFPETDAKYGILKVAEAEPVIVKSPVTDLAWKFTVVAKAATKVNPPVTAPS